MFVGGGIDDIWKTKQDEAVVYEGYGETEINIQAYRWFTSNFETGGTIEIADNTYNLL
jgi:hypothetical protein